ncbi:glycosyltransferase [Planktothrix agardhii]|jgi:glycosyltransferase involved in cell wall biosynthesis|uniref:glycosyltransferase n=1 Tax=Planktothrix agardhii TaxID=1160 RepID=UPI0020A7F766|nr:glycosyltransferase [Planktothrix agardhii]CAD5937901.1 putative glycosyltransferase RBE_0706 [Planktothrix agardhii]
MSLISVIIPVFNGEKTIQDTIKSVLSQTVTDFELIVINDGSTDGTLEIIQKITDARLKVFSYPNANQATSRNRGLEKATSEYIAFLDADDLWTPDKLESQMDALERYPNAALAYSWTNCIDESDQFLHSGTRANFSGNVYQTLLLADFISNGSNALVRKQALDEVGNFNVLLPPAEDWDLWLRLACRYPFVVVPKPQVLYRQSRQSSSSNLVKQEAAMLKVIEKAFNEAPDAFKPLQSISLGNTYKYLMFKSLQAQPSQTTALMTIKFLKTAIHHDPILLKSKVLIKIVLKLGIMMLLPPIFSEKLLVYLQTILNTSTLLGYIQLTP